MEDLDYRFYVLMILPFQLAMCSVKNLRFVSLLNFVLTLSEATVRRGKAIVWIVIGLAAVTLTLIITIAIIAQVAQPL